jgi:CBS-domain-containing membrane protein
MFHKMKGGAPIPPKPADDIIIKASLFGLIAIGLIAALAEASATPLILGSFGASCVILGFPDSPFAQPRNVVLGHVLSTAVGLVCLSLFGAQYWSMALAVCLAIAVMHKLGVVHPPAGSNPVIVMLAQPGWSFLLFPTLTGAVLLVLVALVYHNLPQDKSYPKYW